MDVRSSYRELVGKEIELKSELKKGTTCNVQTVIALRQNLCSRVETLLKMDIEFSASKELEILIWKPVFYKRIEEFRKRIRKYATISTEQGIQQFQRISNDFRRFLEESTQFYERLHLLYRNGITNTNLSFDNSESLDQKKCRVSCHRCLIFLGDLARYRELHNQKTKKDFTKAEFYYHKALVILPSSGNPHNQLAVLATYSDAECIAVYRYCRSLLVSTPFVTSQDNLVLLLEKNRHKTSSDSTIHFTSLDEKNTHPKEKAAALKTFLQYCIRIQGVFFACTSKSDKIPNTEYNVNETKALMISFSNLLNTKALGDALLLKIMVIAIFSIVRLQNCEHPSASFMKEHAVAFLIDICTLTLEYIVHRDVWMNLPALFTGEHVVEGSVVPSALRILGPVVVSLDFLSSMWNLDMKLKYPLFVQAMSKVCTLLPELSTRMKTMSERNANATKESVELRGFLPLRATPCYHVEGPVPTQPLSDAHALLVHGMKLRAFGAILDVLDTMGTSTSPVPVVYDRAIVSDKPVFRDNIAAMEDDDDDEVIVFRPSVDQSQKNVPLSSPSFPLSKFEEPILAISKTVPPGLSLFSDSSSLFSGTTNTMWSTIVASENKKVSPFLPSFLQDELNDIHPMDQLKAIETEMATYGRAISSLIDLLPRPPPGFESEKESVVLQTGQEEDDMLYTSNPFLVGHRNSNH